MWELKISELDISKNKHDIDGHLVSTLGGCGGLERTDFYQFPLWEGVVVLKELNLKQFLFWEGIVVLKELTFNSFILWTGVLVLKKVIFNNFYFGQVWWSWKNQFLSVSTLGGCGGSWKDWLLTVSTLSRCGSLERTDFYQFSFWEGVVVLKEMLLIISTLGRCGGLERSDFEQFLLWEGVAVLKEQNLLICFLDLACKFCMLHGFKEPTTQTTAEAEANWTLRRSHQQVTPLQTRGVTSYADQCRSWDQLPWEPWGEVTSRHSDARLSLQTRGGVTN